MNGKESRGLREGERKVNDVSFENTMVSIAVHIDFERKINE